MVRINRFGIGFIEFLNQREDKRRIPFQLGNQIIATPGNKFLCLHISQNATVLKRITDLLIQFFPVGQYDNCRRTFKLPSYFTRQKQHGITFATSLCMPEHAQFSMHIFPFPIHFYGLIYAQILMISGQDFHCFPIRMVIKQVVFQQVEEVLFLTDTT